MTLCNLLLCVLVGAFAIYLEPWHADVFEFLDLRKCDGLSVVDPVIILNGFNMSKLKKFVTKLLLYD